MNDIEQRHIKMFCAIFVSVLAMVVLLAAFSSFGLTFQW
jgi:hypothetical protein